MYQKCSKCGKMHKDWDGFVVDGKPLCSACFWLWKRGKDGSS